MRFAEAPIANAPPARPNAAPSEPTPPHDAPPHTRDLLTHRGRSRPGILESLAETVDLADGLALRPLDALARGLGLAGHLRSLPTGRPVRIAQALDPRDGLPLRPLDALARGLGLAGHLRSLPTGRPVRIAQADHVVTGIVHREPGPRAGRAGALGHAVALAGAAVECVAKMFGAARGRLQFATELARFRGQEDSDFVGISSHGSWLVVQRGEGPLPRGELGELEVQEVVESPAGPGVDDEDGSMDVSSAPL